MPIRLWLRAFIWLVRHAPPPIRRSVAFVGNRTTWTLTTGVQEWTTCSRRTNQPDAYTREELVEMLETIRKHEAVQGWRVPEPGANRRLTEL